MNVMLLHVSLGYRCNMKCCLSASNFQVIILGVPCSHKYALEGVEVDPEATGCEDIRDSSKNGRRLSGDLQIEVELRNPKRGVNP